MGVCETSNFSLFTFSSADDLIFYTRSYRNNFYFMMRFERKSLQNHDVTLRTTHGRPLMSQYDELLWVSNVLFFFFFFSDFLIWLHRNCVRFFIFYNFEAGLLRKISHNRPCPHFFDAFSPSVPHTKTMKTPLKTEVFENVHPRSQGLFPTPPPPRWGGGVGKRPWERGCPKWS